jgi:hypothetical protein
MFVAWNCKHEAAVVGLPAQQHGRAWRLVADTGKPAPYDFIAVDEKLSTGDAWSALAQAAAWTRQDTYAMLPWSCLVLESVEEGLVEDPCGIDRWDGMQQWSEPVAGTPGMPSVDEGDFANAPPIDAVLSFGTDLKDQRMGTRPGEPTPQSAVAAARSAAAGQPATLEWGPDDAELQALAHELLGSTSDLVTMSPAEKQEMLKILRENLELRKRLES